MMIYLEEIPVERIDEFWDCHIRYLTDDGIISDREDVEYFTGDEYRGTIREHMASERNRHHLIWFISDGSRIGAASYCVYDSGDGECFILDFWVFPHYRGNGSGHRCYEALEKAALSEGAKYFTLNSEKPESVRFWKSLGYAENGRDDYGMPLYIKKDIIEKRKSSHSSPKS